MELSTTVSMWLGVAFVVLAIAASILQAWLWSFPMVPDPGGPDPNGKSTAPKHWTQAHRMMGGLYLVIYVVLMIEMVPRLWEYQFELPPRTVIHACMGLVIGIVLVTKISIIRWFQHFGKALPTLGLWLLGCTIVLATLSIPFAIRAHDFGDALKPKNLDRVKRLLGTIDWEGAEVDVDKLATEEGFQKGVRVLTTKCTACHDIRTILYKPRTANGWYKVVKRMQEKPTVGERMYDHEIPTVTAYLVAITPDLQESYKAKKTQARKKAAAVKQTKQTTTAPTTVAVPPEVMAKGKALVGEKCSDCHGMEEIDGHGKDDATGWSKVLAAMVDEGAELNEEETRTLIQYLTAAIGK